MGLGYGGTGAPVDEFVLEGGEERRDGGFDRGFGQFHGRIGGEGGEGGEADHALRPQIQHCGTEHRAR
ncbi:MAG: hypothetical protein OXE04_07885 [bacterium]|nr:hypothetical protein [bacterium]